MSKLAGPALPGAAVLLRQVERLVGEATRFGPIEDPPSMLLVLSLRAQLAEAINEMADDCAAMRGEIAAFKLRRTATAAYGTMVATRRISLR